MAENKIIRCLLDKDPMQDPECSKTRCRTCGWNPQVRDQRDALRKAGGLKLCEDGLTRLLLPGTEAAKKEERDDKIVSANQRECAFCGRAFTRRRIDQKCCCTACGRRMGSITAKEKRKQKKETI